MDKPMLQRNWQVYIPALLALLMLAVDKIVYIPGFRDCCTVSGSTSFYRSTMEYNFDQEVMFERARERGRSTAMNFGSSRSLPFYAAPTDKQVAESRYLSPLERETLSRWEIVNAAYPGSSMLTSYVRLNQWLDHGARPGVVFVELDPLSVTNRTTWFVTELKFGVPVRFVLGRVFEMPWEHSKTVLGSRIFAMSRYRIGAANQGLSDWERMMSGFASQQGAVRDENAILGEGYEPGRMEPMQAIINLRVVQVLEQDLFKSYRMEPTLASYVELIAERGQREGVPIVFWDPPASDDMRRLRDQYVNRYAWERLLRRIRENGAHYLDVSRADSIECKRYIDPVHFAAICAPEVAAKQLTFFESLPPRRD